MLNLAWSFMSHDPHLIVHICVFKYFYLRLWPNNYISWIIFLKKKLSIVLPRKQTKLLSFLTFLHLFFSQTVSRISEYLVWLFLWLHFFNYLILLFNLLSHSKTQIDLGRQKVRSKVCLQPLPFSSILCKYYNLFFWKTISIITKNTNPTSTWTTKQSMWMRMNVFRGGFWNKKKKSQIF